jgi:hypothetical protein
VKLLEISAALSSRFFLASSVADVIMACALSRAILSKVSESSDSFSLHSFTRAAERLSNSSCVRNNLAFAAYAGYSPATVEMFRNLWRRHAPEAKPQYRVAEQGQLFD